MSDTTPDQVLIIYDLLAKLFEDVTVDNGYHHTIDPESILYQHSPQTIKKPLPIIYIYHDGIEFEGGTSGRFGAAIQYSIVGETGTTKDKDDLLQNLLYLESDLLTVLWSDFYLQNTATSQGKDVSLDHHSITRINTDGGLLYPKALLEIQGEMYFHNITLPLL